jgi:hypothetical protein
MYKLCLLTVALSCAAATWAADEEPWKAKGPATSFIADWSAADARDAAATAAFLKEVWPRLAPASAALEAQLKAPAAPFAGAASAAEKDAGIVVFPVAAERVLSAFTVPTAEEVANRKVSLYAARGQSEAFGIAVHGLADTTAVSVACSDLTGAGTIPAAAVTTRLSLIYTVNPLGRGKDIHSRQMQLLKVPSWDVAKGRTCEWIVDVHVPADAKSGAYAGKITVQVGGRAAAVVDLAFEVLPFALTDNGCRWGMFMAANPGQASEAWCDLNARYGFNTTAWWHLDVPYLNWTWDGCMHDPAILSKPRKADGSSLAPGSKELAAVGFPQWLMDRWDGTFFAFKPEEVLDFPADDKGREAAFKKPLKLKPELGALTPEQAALVVYDRMGMNSNFTPDKFDSVKFQQDEAFATFDAGMKRLLKYGFAGPLTWFGSGNRTDPWEVRVIGHRFGPRYDIKDMAWRREVTPENSNHAWFMANAAVAKSFADARRLHDWPEVVWCPNDENWQNKGVTRRSAANMMGEQMPYIRKLAPEARIYAVVWHKKGDKVAKGPKWQCAALQRDAVREDGKVNPDYGPYHVICSNCPNDEDRDLTWKAGGEYWNYIGACAAQTSFGSMRYGFGFGPARHYAAVTYGFADSSKPHNPAPDEDLAKSIWLTGEYTMNYYLAKDMAAPALDLALATHQTLACRAGTNDRRYLETLRVMAHEKKSADDIAFVGGIGARIEQFGTANQGGVDDFEAKVKDEGGVVGLRREIAMRLKALATK